jgi:hypothetical protein
MPGQSRDQQRRFASVIRLFQRGSLVQQLLDCVDVALLRRVVQRAGEGRRHSEKESGDRGAQVSHDAHPPNHS